MTKWRMICLAQFILICVLACIIVVPRLRRTPQERLETKLSRIVIPELDFREASIPDVLNFLAEASREFDGKETNQGKKGVSIMLDLGKPEERGPPITFSARYITLLDAITVLSRTAGVKYSTANGVLTFEPAEGRSGPTTNSTPITE